jgi:putative DNA primase/helicase
MSIDLPVIQTLNDLKGLPQWVCYDQSKKPINPSTGYGADCNDPTSWGTYDQARLAWKRNGYPGLGFEFVKEQELTGIDLDKCVIDGEISDFAQGILNRLNSYAEYSPSGTGIHIWVRGSIPANLKASDGPAIEMYDRARYFTVTGKRVSGTPETIEDRQEELTKLYAEITEQRNNAQKKIHRQPKVINFPGLDSHYGLAALDIECQDLASTPNGSRNEQLNRAAYSLGQLIAGNELSRSTVERELYTAAERAGLSHHEIERTMKSGIESGMKSPRTRPVDDIIYGTSEDSAGIPQPNSNKPPDINFILKCLAEGEYGDSQLFAHLFKGQVIYDHTSQEWYLWAGHWWKCDETGKIKHLVSGKLASVFLQACAMLYEQSSQKVAKAETGGDEKELELAREALEANKKTIKELTGRAYSLRQASRLKNVLYFASAHDGMGIIASQWDCDPWLLGVPNGVLDLRTGGLRDGKPADYIRTTSPTEWKGLHAPAPRWERFLEEIFEDRTPEERKELISFLQRLLGYGITGVVMEHIFAVFYGEDGRNGKDTIQKALTDTLGSVSGAIHKDVLLDTGRGHSAGAPTPHLSDLQGRRLAWASEPEKGARFNVGQIKELSGGGDIATRGLHEKKITKLKPSHLLILLTNHKPHADANDAAFWDRLRLITFNMRFVDDPQAPNERKKDLTLWSQLAEEASGILAWLIRGCLDWKENGLNTPQTVLNAGVAYRNEEDVLKTFMDECCIIKEDARTKASTLYETYKMWAQDGNLHVMNKTVFGLQLSKKKFTKVTTKHGIFYHGLGLLTTEGEQLVNSSSLFQNYSPSSEPASEAPLDSIRTNDGEQCEQFQRVFSKSSSREDEFLEKPVKTIHTIHPEEKGIPLEELVEPVNGRVNSLEDSPKLFTGAEKLFTPDSICSGCLDQGVETPATFEFDEIMYCSACYERLMKKS